MTFNDQTIAMAQREAERRELFDDGFLVLKPTDEGFATIAARFFDQVIADVKQPRRKSDSELLIEAIKIVAMLGRNGQDQLLWNLIRGIER